ncbi:MAG: ornithine carbamoyltransferase [Halobacteria archaeon]|nr:ornithine carbamoyltransferase [Halobacteria archaeon]
MSTSSSDLSSSLSDFIGLDSVSRHTLRHLLDEARRMKSQYEEMDGHPHPPLGDRTLGMVFQKPSTRTRVSFETGMTQLGGHAVYLSENDIQLRRGETVADTARALSGYVDGIMARVHDHGDVLELAEHADVPVINGLSDYNHPCQALADFFTIQEVKGDLDEVDIAWVGDGNNVCHSLLHASSKLGSNIRVATPEGLEPDSETVENSRSFAEESGSEVLLTHDPSEAVNDADVIYTDAWVSMGDDNREEKLEKFDGFQVNSDLLGDADDSYVFMHCLPAHRGEEVTDEVMDGDHSVIWRQAENRMHVQKSVLKRLLLKQKG